jgi:hypothetical protein
MIALYESDSKLKSFVLYIFVAMIAIGTVLAQEGDVARVRVVVRDTFGSPVSPTRITLSAVGPDNQFVASRGDATFDQVPYGVYDIAVHLAGFITRVERVRIFQPNAAFQLGLELAGNHAYERAELSGAVNAAVKGRPDLWVRLIGFYTSDLVENTVDSRGHFELDGMAHGKYLLILFEKEKVIATKAVDVLGGKQNIDLP